MPERSLHTKTSDAGYHLPRMKNSDVGRHPVRTKICEKSCRPPRSSVCGSRRAAHAFSSNIDA
jgi:hypothetical protein